MNIFLRKYRNFITIGILGFYLVGGMQFPLLESLHFLSHLNDQAEGTYQKHNFHSHNNSHQHKTLVALSNADHSSDENAPVNETSDQKAKKFPQILTIAEAKNWATPDKKRLAPCCLICPPLGLVSIPTPPPEA